MSVSVRVSRQPISTDKIIRSVGAAGAGGTVVFIGTVRNKSTDTSRVTALELEAAVELATKDLLRIAKAAKRKFGVAKIAIQHRIGQMKVGEVIVVIAVSAPHRKDAFAGCRFIIDELKKSTPIWKKEFGASTGKWVGSGR